MYPLIILFVIGSASAAGAPPDAPKSPPVQRIPTAAIPQIINQTNEIKPDGSYQWSYETENCISAEEKGKPLDIPEAPIGVVGSYSYKSSDGSKISLSYVADENGFQPVGNHLPVGPPIPPLIARALEWLARERILTKR